MLGASRISASQRAVQGRRAWFALCLCLFAVSFGIATARGFLKPYANWDMVAYVGSAISWQERNPAIIHQKTLEDIKPVVLDRRYKEIAEENALSKNPQHFVQNLPFYATKPVYVASVWLLHKAGFTHTYAAATWIVAALSFGGLAVLLLLWRPEYMNRGIWLLALSTLCWFGTPPFGELARFSTPDSMGAAAIFAAFLALFRLQRPYLGVALMLLSILIRPEAVIFAVMTAAMCFVMGRALSPLTRAQSVVMAISATILYLSIQKLFGNYGYEKFFHYTFVNRVPNPAEVEVHLTLANYLGALAEGLNNIFTDARLLPLLALSVAAVLCHLMLPPTKRLYPWLLLLAWGNYAVRFMLNPAWRDYRFHSINYILILMASGEMISPYLEMWWERLKKRREVKKAYL